MSWCSRNAARRALLISWRGLGGFVGGPGGVWRRSLRDRSRVLGVSRGASGHSRGPGEVLGFAQGGQGVREALTGPMRCGRHGRFEPHWKSIVDFCISSTAAPRGFIGDPLEISRGALDTPWGAWGGQRNEKKRTKAESVGFNTFWADGPVSSSALTHLP